MSEFTNAKARYVRYDLLASASALALAGTLGVSPAVAASGEDGQPAVWIELGGQFERLDNGRSIFAPPFVSNSPAAVVVPLIDAQQQARYSIGGEGKIIFDAGDWSFAASVRYGRSNASKHLHYQSNQHTAHQTLRGIILTSYGRPVDIFGDGRSRFNEGHVLLDFTAGKDFGLGMFGAHSRSVISAGVRFAQFTLKNDVNLNARPEYHTGPIVSYQSSVFSYRFVGANFHNNTGVLQGKRSTNAIGPTMTWDASMPIVGDNAGMSVAIDWGANAAVLFGRQRAHVHHQTSGSTIYEPPGSRYQIRLGGYAHNPPDQNRSRSILIPNIGGFAAISFRYSNAMVKFGYRGDFFFNAMDNGISTRKSENVGFYGPFAAISIGLGG